jgi:lipopolysaccharide transport system permease protein
MTTGPQRILPEAATAVAVIAPPRMSDLWQTLQQLPLQLPLLRVLVWRFAVARYLQSVLGILWLAIQPLVTTLVFLFMFNIISINTSDGSPKGLFLLLGLVVWQFFNRAVQDATSSLVGNRGILTKVYLPKLIFPIASVLAAWFDLLVMLAMLAIVMLVMGVPITERVLLLPVFLLLVTGAALAIGIALSSINALYRDVGFALTFGLQLGIYLTPVLYATKFVPEKWRALYYLNPLATLFEGVRWSVLPASPPPDLTFLWINIMTIVVGLVVALVVFQRLDAEIVDRI